MAPAAVVFFLTAPTSLCDSVSAPPTPLTAQLPSAVEEAPPATSSPVVVLPPPIVDEGRCCHRPPSNPNLDH
jgi:hypothetical protein